MFGSRRQPYNFPGLIFIQVFNSVVQATAAALPKLNRIGNYPVSTPMCRPGYFHVFVLILQFLYVIFYLKLSLCIHQPVFLSLCLSIFPSLCLYTFHYNLIFICSLRFFHKKIHSGSIRGILNPFTFILIFQ